MTTFYTLLPDEPMSLTTKVFLALFFVGMASVILYQFFKFFEQIYGIKHSKPFFVFGHLFNRRLTLNQLKVLQKEFTFYKALPKKHQRYFEHRVASFIKDKEFSGRDGVEVTDQMLVLVSATAVMLTFGFRKYLIETIDSVLIYPGSYYSKINEAYHNGEFNPRAKALVLSWEHFVKGYDISNDNLNLGIHEMTHAIHLNGLKENDISAFIFKNKFLDLTEYLSKNEHLRKKLIETKYFRKYAFTNQFEFLAVLVETFMETPKEFKSRFPKIYQQVKQMLNFDFAGY